MKSTNNIIAVGGMTASGKTDLSIGLARKYGGEIVNADSRQVYRHLDIGTAKEPIDKRNPDGTVMIRGIRHHVIDHVNPNEEYSLARFQTHAQEAIDEILSKGRLPIIVGGTGLYIDSIVYNFDLQEERDSQFYRPFLAEKSVEELQSSLSKIAPNVFEKMTESDKKNPHRLTRAIERNLEVTGAVPKKKTSLYHALYLVLDLPDEELDTRIAQRVDAMFLKGLTKENEILREQGYSTELPSLSAIGYLEFDAYFNGTQSINETKHLIVLHTQQYVKRQRTWFKKNKEALWIGSFTEADRLVGKFLNAGGST